MHTHRPTKTGWAAYALSFTPEELEQMDSTEGETDEGMEKLGEVYYDAETGKYYIIENGK